MRCLLLSDIHANQAALVAVLADAQLLGPIDETWVLGDVTGYGVDPVPVVRWLVGAAESIAPITAYVPGDHDALLVGRVPTGPFSVDALASMTWTAQMLGEFDRADALTRTRPDRSATSATEVREEIEPVWCQLGEADWDVIHAYADQSRRAETVQVLERDGLTFVLVHGSLISPLQAYNNQLCVRGSEPRQPTAVQGNCAAELVRRLGELVDLETGPVEICGHTHVAELITSAPSGDGGWSFQAHDVGTDRAHALGRGPSLINPGSVGCPRDGDSRASYAVLDTTAREVRYRRVGWDGENLRERLNRLPRGLTILASQWPTLVLGARVNGRTR